MKRYINIEYIILNIIIIKLIIHIHKIKKLLIFYLCNFI